MESYCKYGNDRTFGCYHCWNEQADGSCEFRFEATEEEVKQEYPNMFFTEAGDGPIYAKS